MTSLEDHTGVWLFQRYAAPCADNMSNTTISPEVKEEFYHLNDTGATISIARMETFFPNATKSLYLCAKTTGFSPWSLDNVTHYWRNEHRGESPVQKVTLIREKCVDGSPPAWEVSCEGIQINGWVFNTYELELCHGQEVYIHLCSIIERA